MESDNQMEEKELPQNNVPADDERAPQTSIIADSVKPKPAGVKIPFDTMLGIYGNTDTFLKSIPKTALPSVQESMENSIDPDLQRKQIANTIHIANRKGITISEAAKNYDTYMRQINAEDYQGYVYNNLVDTDIFYNRTSEKLKTEDAQRKFMVRQGTELWNQFVRNPGTFNEVYSQGHDKRVDDPDYIDANADMYYVHQRDLWNKWQKTYGTQKEAINTAAEYYQMSKTGVKDEDKARYNNLNDKLKTLLTEQPEESQNQILQLAALNVAKTPEEKAKESFGGKLIKSVEEGAGEEAQMIVDYGKQKLFNTAAWLTAESDPQYYNSPEGQKAIEDTRKYIDTDRRIKSFLNNTVDPTSSDNFIANATLGLAKSVPTIITQMLPLGWSVNYTAISQELAGQYVDKGESPQHAQYKAQVAAIPLTMLMGLDSQLVLGNVGKQFVGNIKSRVGQYVANAAIEAPIAGVSIGLSQAVPFANDMIFNAFSDTFPKADFSQFRKEFANATPQTIASAVMMGLVGAGVASYKDISGYKQKELLRAMGVQKEITDALQEANSIEQAQAILEAANYDFFYGKELPEKMAADEAAFEQFKRTPTPQEGVEEQDIAARKERAEEKKYSQYYDKLYDEDQKRALRNVNGKIVDDLIGKEVLYRGYKGTLIRDEEGRLSILKTIRERGEPLLVEVENVGKQTGILADDIGITEPVKAQQLPLEQALRFKYPEKTAGVELPEKQEKVADVPTGTENEVKPLDPQPSITKTEEGYHVTDEQGKTIASTNTAEMAAQVVKDHQSGKLKGSAVDQWADQVIERAKKEALTKLNVGIDPTIIAAYAVKGAVKLEQGITDFADWAKDMVNDYGESITPELKNIYNAAKSRLEMDKYIPPKKNAWDDIKRLLMPESRGEAAAKVAGRLRELQARLQLDALRAEQQLKDIRKTLGELSLQDRYDWIDKIQTGQGQDSEKLRQGAETVSEMFDELGDRIANLGTGAEEHFQKNYFPQLWKDPAKAETFLNALLFKAPFEGTRGFLKKKTFKYFKDGLNYGLEPISSNPVDLVLRRAMDMNKYILTHEFVNYLRNHGIATFVQAAEKPPLNFARIDDPSFTVYGRPNREGAIQVNGYYYVPQEAALILNNYLAPGVGGSKLLTGYNRFANALNAINLTLSAFHAGFIVNDSMVSQIANGIDYMAAGQPIKGLKQIASFPAAPVKYLWMGAKLQREARIEGSVGGDYSKILEAAILGGGRPEQPSDYDLRAVKAFKQNFDNWKSAWANVKEGDLKAAGKDYTVAGMKSIMEGPLAALELMSYPLLKWAVPKFKLGVFMDMAALEYQKLSPDATPDEVIARMGKVWDSVDNRMGELVQDNLFWNKTFKQLTNTTIRSTGWDLGSLREVGGGILNTAEWSYKKVTGKWTGAEATWNRKTSYIIALAAYSALAGSIIQYLYTGKGPSSIKDAMFPRTGKKDQDGRDIRLSLPTYTKEVYSFFHDPVRQAKAKIHPAIGITYDALNNTDYYGDKIRNSDDPLLQKFEKTATYVLKQSAPIGLRLDKPTATYGEIALASAGYVEANKDIEETEAEQLASEIMRGKMKNLAPKEQEQIETERMVKRALRTGDPEAQKQADTKLRQMVAAGDISDAQRRAIEKGKNRTFLQNEIGRMSPSEALRVAAVATPQERESLRSEIALKLQRSKEAKKQKDKDKETFDKIYNANRNPLQRFKQ